MRSSHRAGRVRAVFDDPNLIADAGLVPLVRLAEQAGLPELVDQLVKITDADNSGGANPAAKVVTLVAGMAADADSIDDVDSLRHTGMQSMFDDIRAPSTLGTFLRSFTHGHALQLHAVHRKLLAALAHQTPLLPGADHVVFVDIDPTHKRVYGRAKQGAEIGRFKGIRTLHPILATISTPLARPVIAGVRLRRGKSADVRGAARFVAEALATAREAGATGTTIVRADSKFYSADVVAACRRHGAHFSLATGMNPSIARAITTISDDAWTPIRYPHAIEDPDTGELISEAEVAGIVYTAFTSRPQAAQVTAMLTVRRVMEKATSAARNGQGELFPVYRYHPIFTDSPFDTVPAEADHRRHAIIEQIISEAKNGPLAHLPSGNFHANAAWTILCAMTHNLLRAAGCMASVFHSKATTNTLRTQLIRVPSRLARSAGYTTVHLPRHWPWEHAWTHFFQAVHGPPGRAA